MRPMGFDLPIFLPFPQSSGPLHWLLPLPGAHFPRYLSKLLPYLLRSVLSFSVRPSLISSLKSVFSSLLLNFLLCFIFLTEFFTTQFVLYFTYFVFCQYSSLYPTLHEGKDFSAWVHCYLPNICNSFWHILSAQRIFTK